MFVFLDSQNDGLAEASPSFEVPHASASGSTSDSCRRSARSSLAIVSARSSNERCFTLVWPKILIADSTNGSGTVLTALSGTSYFHHFESLAYARGTRGRLTNKIEAKAVCSSSLELAGRIGLDTNAEPEGRTHASFGSGSPSLSVRRSARSSFPIDSARTSVTRCLMPSRSYSRVRTAPCTIT